MIVIYKIGFDLKMHHNIKRYIAVGISIVGMGLFNSYYRQSSLYLVVYIIFTIMVYYTLFQDRHWKDLIIIFWGTGVITAIDGISYVVVRLYFDYSKLELNADGNLYASVITILFLLLLFMPARFKKKGALEDLALGYYIVFFLICFIDASILVVIQTELLELNVRNGVIYILLVVSSLIQMAFVLVLASSNNWYRKNEGLNRKFLELQNAHYEYLEKKNRNTQKFRHDMRAHMYILKQYLSKNRLKDGEQYIDSICEDLQYTKGYIDVKNGIANAILNYYSEQLKHIMCTFDVKGNLPLNCNIKAYDLCVIFSNLLSNALEATENAAKQYIDLVIHFDETMIYIREKNSYNGKINIQNGNIITTKKEKEIHGFGLENIKESVAKYNGNVEVKTTKDEFTIDIIIENM